MVGKCWDGWWICMIIGTTMTMLIHPPIDLAASLDPSVFHRKVRSIPRKIIFLYKCKNRNFKVNSRKVIPSEPAMQINYSGRLSLDLKVLSYLPIYRIHTLDHGNCDPYPITVPKTVAIVIDYRIYTVSFDSILMLFVYCTMSTQIWQIYLN